MKNRNYCLIAAFLFLIIGNGCSQKTVEYYYRKEFQKNKESRGLLLKADDERRMQFWRTKSRTVEDSLSRIGRKMLVQMDSIEQRDRYLKINKPSVWDSLRIVDSVRTTLHVKN